ncbi:MAG: nucleotidyltransferase domain-containing protein [Bacteroidota bacterium]
MLSFGAEIRKLRNDKQVPLRTVAAFLDIDQAILSKIERGIRQANREQVYKLAEYFDADKDLLLKSWLSDRIVYEMKDEDFALEAIKLAEEKVAYLTLKAPILDVIKPQLIEVFKTDPRIRKGWIFGSVARNEADWKSDIDVMILVDETSNFSLFDLAEIQYQGEKAIGHKIDIVIEGAVKPFAVESVNNDRILVYEK